ncbi:hypothetical protein RND71_008885 [Anisodus tanguticus]|uniref:Uncharacterized protein n=1 Tax=Anisodus tanguticus TaxID=243964 RepID=A0AAE1SPT0_9SOLA|nr:hypothetical protein RND71_008885 [Anisodus tanguticus]
MGDMVLKLETRLGINKFGWPLLTVLKRLNKLICPRKSEFDMLIKGNNKENKPKNCDQTLDAAGVGRSGKIGSPKTTRFQPESAAEETFHANQFMNSKEAELQSNMPIQEDADLWMEQWVQLPGGKEVIFLLKLGLPIIDNYGSLLGEFSCLDNPQYILDRGCDDE